ncbi:hypothetical protein, partial [Escherichia fergusonii]|uniref:hypothetical protein n=1 Tax=Escherichia fergusonii TaxID=564 RepID=UPI001C5C9FF6
LNVDNIVTVITRPDALTDAQWQGARERLTAQGFKILLDIVATAGGKLRVVEVPFSFGARQHGESKLDSLVVLDFLGLVLAKLTGDLVS